MTTIEIEMLTAALRSACEERDLMAKGLLDCYEYDYDNKFYCGCCGQSFGVGEDLDEHLVHGAGCPVLVAEKIMGEDTS